MNEPTRRQLKVWRSLRHRRDRESEGLFLVEGRRLIDELLASPVTVRDIVAETDAALPEGAEGLPVWRVRRRKLEELSATDSPQGVIAVAEIPNPDVAACLAADRLLVLDAVGDPGNAGTLIRAARAFGACAVLFTPGSVSATNAKLVRASMGGLFALPWAEGVSPGAVAAAGHSVLAADAGSGTDPADLVVPPRWALVLGSEAHGLGSWPTATRVRIPLASGAESLNVAMAGTVLLYRLASTP